MKSGKKALLLALCAVLLVAATVMGTMAYLTATTETVVNTFTIGNIAITLDETKVDVNGTAVTPAARTRANAYKLMPGHEYKKDPTVHVAGGSENSWIFVKVENGISGFEAATAEGGYKKIADQITANGWAALDGNTGVYYKEYTQVADDVDLVVFSNFKIADNADQNTGWKEFNDETKVTVTAYAVQKDGFDTPAAAWQLVGATVTPGA